MRITEKDLFIYIFYPEKLADNVRKYIANKSEKFHSELELLSEIKKNMNSSIPQDVKNKIMSEIEANEDEKEIFLYKSIEKHPSAFALEASSVEEPSALTETFQDEKKQILVKIVSQKKKSKIYYFHKYADKNVSVYLRFYPSLKTFLVNLKSPLVVDRLIYISKIGSMTLTVINLFALLSDFSIFSL